MWKLEADASLLLLNHTVISLAEFDRYFYRSDGTALSSAEPNASISASASDRSAIGAA